MGTTTAPSGFGRPIWNAIKGGNQVHGVGLIPIVTTFTWEDTSAGGFATDYSDPIFTAGSQSETGYWKVEAANLISHTATGAVVTNGSGLDIVVGSGATLNDTFYPLIHPTGTNGYTTLTQSMTVGTKLDMTIAGPDNATPKNVFLAEGDSILLKTSELGAGRDLSAVDITLTLYLRHAPPGR